MRRRSIKTKFMASISILVLGTLMISLIVALLLAMRVFRTTNELSLAKTALLGQQEVEEWFSGREEWMQTIAAEIRSSNAGNLPEITQKLKIAGERYIEPEQIYIGTSSGKFLSSTDWVPPTEYDPRERDWYKDARAIGELTYQEPYVDFISGKIVISLCMPVKDFAGEDIGVLSMDIPLDTLMQEINGETIMNNGRAFLLDKDGVFVTHENERFVLKDESTIEPHQYFANSGIKLGSNIAEVEKDLHLSRGKNWDGTASYIALAEISNGWQYGFAVPVSDLNAVYFRLMLGFGAIIAVMLAVTMFFASRIIGGLLKPIQKMIVVAGDIAVGKVDVAIDIHTGDELEELAQQFDSLANNVSKQVAVMDAMADGDFSGQVVPRSQYDGISNAINKVNQRLQVLTDRVKAAASQVTQGSVQMSASSHALAQATVQQASAVEELSGFQGQVLSNTKESAKLARKANTVFATVKEQTGEGARSMGDMVQAVGEIEEAAANITKVIKAIEDIAFQTNILALNAGVEAARAGAQGKGFAVVADEVRRLAAKSAAAVKETKELIAAASNKAGNGVEIAKNAQEIFNAIAGGIDDAVEMVEFIDTSASNQVAEITELAGTVSELSVVIQRNSSTAEQSAATSEEMNAQAQMLHSLVEGLRTGNEEKQARPQELPNRAAYYPSLDGGEKY